MNRRDVIRKLKDIATRVNESDAADISNIISYLSGPDKSGKRSYGEYDNVQLTDTEYTRLLDEYPDARARIDRLSEYLATSGKSYKSHYATIRAWARSDAASAAKSNTGRYAPTYDMAEIEELMDSYD